MVVSSTIVRPPAAACQVGADAPLEVNTYPFVPVDPARARVLVTFRVVTVAAAADAAPIVVPSIEPALMSAVSAIRLSMLAVPSINRLRHS